MPEINIKKLLVSQEMEQRITRVVSNVKAIFIIGLWITSCAVSYRIGYSAIYQKFNLIDKACTKGGGTVATERVQLFSGKVPDVEFYCIK